MQQKALRLLKLLLSYLPSKLPNTPQSVEDWLQDVLSLSGYPDNPGFRSAALTATLHLPERTLYKPKQFFVRNIKAAVVRQQAFQAIEDIRDKAKEERAAAGVLKAPTTPLV